jgi:hypothetical protein
MQYPAACECSYQAHLGRIDGRETRFYTAQQPGRPVEKWKKPHARWKLWRPEIKVYSARFLGQNFLCASSAALVIQRRFNCLVRSLPDNPTQIFTRSRE